MSFKDYWEIVSPFVMVLFTVIGILLRNKDARQQREFDQYKKETALLITGMKTEFNSAIDKLWDKHDADVIDLQSVRDRLNSRHYDRTEIDSRLGEIKQGMEKGFDMLGAKIERLGEMMVGHVMEEKKK
jgi:hypothetical protein